MAALLAACALVAVAGCAASHPPLPRPAVQHADPPRPDGAFTALEASIRSTHGAEASGFQLLERNEDGLTWRLALVDSARHTLDLQYYIWSGDAGGVLLMKRVIAAADRGVKVRLIIDDLDTMLKDAETLAQRDVPTAQIDAHPHIAIRLFNPWYNRALIGRGAEAALDLKRLNHRMPTAIRDLLTSAQREILIVNAYIIPDATLIETLRELTGRKVRVHILTNSLASHDVPAVNSHYKRWRRPLIEAGIELYEIRRHAALKVTAADTPPTVSHFMGLHVKALAIDRTRVFVGSMNLDPRSATLNSEMGVVIESPGLAEALARVMENDMTSANS